MPIRRYMMIRAFSIVPWKGRFEVRSFIPAIVSEPERNVLSANGFLKPPERDRPGLPVVSPVKARATRASVLAE